jgi:hypothetical protein
MTKGAATALDVSLPGGVLVNGTLCRDGVFKRLTGYIEQLVAEAASNIRYIPQRVSSILCEALDTLGGVNVDYALAAGLCIGDRHYLMLRLAALIDGERLWLRPECTSCGSLFDLGLDRLSLPVKKAKDGFPFFSVHVRDKELNVRVPNGRDQEYIVSSDDSTAVRDLLKKCIVSVSGQPSTDEYISGLSDADIKTISRAMEEVAPAVTTGLPTSCPECQSEQTVYLDPYEMTGTRLSSLYQEVHTLAYNYHWSEQEILALPHERRQMYLRLIDHGRGFRT